ncbi:unnamed protein product [Parascedosporium putredinis]|uniref:alpha-1,2-Mannosidase n=1 Tax=Parascedosporium putredinis TaxID=1442378 RepID=A0A9P1MAU9_9PEZI|nr:unnamed protein product [Parascedosporium putredinis]CAI7994793.1 unnamed protein product [Parascedosporium putredinis]
MRDEEDKPAKAAEPAPENDGSYRYPRPEPAAKIARRDGGEAQDSNVAEPAPAGSAADTNPDSLAAALSQIPIEVEEDPYKPPTHLEFVKNRIANEKIPPGFSKIPSKHYILRPEAIESVWYMYRITGDPVWQEKGWRMWKSIIEAVRTEVGHSAIHDVLMEKSPQKDSMESFWLAETLKYFYLLFATPDVLSLDEWVLNTEAHPFRRPDAKKA